MSRRRWGLAADRCLSTLCTIACPTTLRSKQHWSNRPTSVESAQRAAHLRQAQVVQACSYLNRSRRTKPGRSTVQQVLTEMTARESTKQRHVIKRPPEKRSALESGGQEATNQHPEDTFRRVVHSSRVAEDKIRHESAKQAARSQPKVVRPQAPECQSCGNCQNTGEVSSSDWMGGKPRGMAKRTL